MFNDNILGIWEGTLDCILHNIQQSDDRSDLSARKLCSQ